ncbi:MAG: hypothetical protein ABMA13_15235 [Chthoniobacteraceae bacterium]
MHRLAAFIIVIFWFVMTLLLVRNEIAPDASRLREVPIAHVLKLLYLHEQASALGIYNGPNSIGNVRLHPHFDKHRKTRVLDISGDFHLALSPEQKTRFGWLGLLDLSPAGEIQRSRWSVTILDPTYLRADIDTPEGGKVAHFTLRTRERVIHEGDLPMNEAGLTGLAKQLPLGSGLDALIAQGRQQAPATIRARQSSLRWRGERTETYLISVEQNGQTLIEAHFSQLGQALYATTLLGYTLRSIDLAP